MNEVIERVARAICLSQGYDPEFNYDPDGLGAKFGRDLRWRLFVDAAIMAIEAMREPTETMIEAGYEVGYSPDPLPTEAVWRAMIDASLSKAKPSQGDGNE